MEARSVSRDGVVAAGECQVDCLGRERAMIIRSLGRLEGGAAHRRVQGKGNESDRLRVIGRGRNGGGCDRRLNLELQSAPRST